MASATDGIRKVIDEEGSFQNDPDDTGNFLNGVNYGTKFGITAGAWRAFYKKPLQADTIRNLTVDQAIPIYKRDYWDRIGGDLVENNSIASLMMFIVVNSGVGKVKDIKTVMNQVAGKKIITETTAPMTAAEVHLLNELPQQKFFDALKGQRENYYRNLAANPQYAKYLKGWLNRLDAHTFEPEKKNP